MTQQALLRGEVPPALTASQIVAAIQALHPAPPVGQWITFAELRVGTGYGAEAEQRIDFWAMNAWPSHNFERHAYEVKASRADLLSELRKPQKRRRALLLSNRFFFAVPKGLMKIEELPIECGLVEINEYGYADVRVAAPWRDTPAPTWRFMAAVLRRALTEGCGARG